MRKLLLALLAAALLFPVIVAPVLAANPTNCSSPENYNDHANINVPQIGNNIRGIKATMYASNRIAQCIDTNGLDIMAGPLYWVALTGPASNESAIIQIGVTNCNNAVQSGCQDTARLFWAYGGCDGDRPDLKDLGPAPPSGAVFQVSRESDGYYRVYANGTFYRSIYKTHPSIVCWADTGTVTADIACERWDAGDMCGQSALEVAVHGAKTQKSVEGTWYVSGFHSGSCQESNSETQCTILDEDSAYLWTVQ